MPQYYKIFGLKISSSHPLGVLPTVKPFKKHDVEIKRKNVSRPADGLEHTIYKPFSVLNKDLFFLEVNEIAKFLIKGKDQIHIEKISGASWQDVYAFLFDNVFIMMALKNDIFLFHATSVAFGQEAFMFCGPGGLGKSTLAASLAKSKKAKIIEDDKCLLQFNAKTKSFQIINQFPYLELWKLNAPLVKPIKKITYKNKVRKNLEKFRFDISEHTPKRKVTLNKIILLYMTSMEDEIVLNELKGLQKVNAVKHFVHMEKYVHIFGKNKELFQTIAKIVNGVRVFTVNKSRLTKLNDFLQFIETEIVEKH